VIKIKVLGGGNGETIVMSKRKLGGLKIRLETRGPKADKG